MRHAGVQRPFHGLYAHGLDLADLGVRCRVLLPAMLPEHAVSHVTAARLWGLPLPRWIGLDDPLHVIAVGSHRRLRRAGVVAWETADRTLARVLLGKVPVVAAAEVWGQLAVPGSVAPRRALTPEWLVAVGDALVTPQRRANRQALSTIDELRAVAARRAGTRGVTSLVWAIDRIRMGAESPKETELRLGLIAGGLPEPETQVPVMTSAGLRHADLGYPEQRVLLEYQGDEHRASRVRWLEDLTRRQLFEDAGYRVIEVGAHDLWPTCAPLVARVRRALVGRSWG